MNKKLFYVLLAILSAICLASCSVLHKIKSSKAVSIDSSYTSVSDSADIRHRESTNFASRDSTSSNSEEITLTFFEEKQPCDTCEKVNDYEAAATKNTARKGYDYTIGGRTITTPLPIKTAVIKNERTGSVSSLDVHQLVDQHSSVKHDSNTAKLIRKEVTAEKKTDKFKFSWLQLILVIAGLALLYWIGLLILRWIKKMNKSIDP